MFPSSLELGVDSRNKTSARYFPSAERGVSTKRECAEHFGVGRDFNEPRWSKRVVRGCGCAGYVLPLRESDGTHGTKEEGG